MLKFKLFIFFLAFLVVSCKKANETQELPTKETKKVLSKLTQIGPQQTLSTANITNFTYDDQGRLVLEKGTLQEFQYIYKQNQLIQVLQHFDNYQVSGEIVYEGTKISKISNLYRYKNGLPDITSVLNCFYDGDKLSRVERIENSKLMAQYQYQYSGEKLTKATLRNSDLAVVSTIDYTSDDKKNIYFGLSTPTLQALKLLRSQPPTLNNFTSEMSSTYTLDKVTYTWNNGYEYSYDNDGYPLTATRTYVYLNVSTPEITKYIYEYKILEL